MSHRVVPDSAFHPALAALAVLALAACEASVQSPAPAQAPPMALAASAPAAVPLGDAKGGEQDAEQGAASYRCANGERLRVSYRRQDAAMITYRGETHFLPLAKSASGARYAGDGWQWWIKGQAEGALSRLPSDAAVAPGAGVVCKVEIATQPESALRPGAEPSR